MPFKCQIIGYGNPQRRDDGIGPYVVNRLRPYFKDCRSVRLRILHQLDPVLATELENSGIILFVDATAEVLTEGRQWTPVQPELEFRPWLLHQVTPAVLLGLLQFLYNCSPPAWTVAVQGEDFDFGCGMTAAARKRARQVTDEIVKFVEAMGRQASTGRLCTADAAVND